MPLEKALAEGDYAALLDDVRAAPGWTEESLALVHMALIGWCERALAMPASSRSAANCAALYDLIGRLCSAHGGEALERIRPGTVSEWRGFELLLDERIAKVDQGAAHREDVLQRKHVQRIVDMLDGGNSLTFKALRDRLEISDSMLSQVLGMMETAQLIERERGENDARVKCVRLTQQELELRRKASRRQVDDEAKSDQAGAAFHTALDWGGWGDGLEPASTEAAP